MKTGARLRATNRIVMKPDEPAADQSASTLAVGGEEQAEALVQILDQYLADLKAGRAVNRATLLAQYPQFAQQLSSCLAGLEFIQGADAAATTGGAPDLVSQQRVLGDFRIVREIGRGGMGAVYEAEQISLGRRVALKVLRFGTVSDLEAIDRFRREAETVARLHHTNIVPIFAVGAAQGVNYYAMQFIEGKSLADLRGEGSAALPADDVVGWGLQAAEALTHAHDRHVIHRDVKPSNLLLDPDGRIWLTDFGLARRMDDVTLSLTGALLGTPRYMSPEQASATRRQVDRRTDIYSLGATLYELLAGRPVFSGDTAHQVIQQILSTEPTPLRRIRPALTRDIETVVMKCLAKDPAQRYGSARELAEDLRACLERRPIRARRANSVERIGRWMRQRQQGVRASVCAVAATLLAGLAWWGASSWYRTAHASSLLLATAQPPLSVALRSDDGQLAAAVTLPTERAIELPEGRYEMRMSSPDRWSQDLTTTLERGNRVKRSLSLDDQQLWMPTSVERWPTVVQDDPAAAVLLWGSDGVACEGGVPKRPRWKVSLKRGQVPAWSGFPGLVWPWFGGTRTAHGKAGPTDHAPAVAAHSVDLNGDGQGDFLVAAQHQAFVFALSGSDGSVLWCAARGADVSSSVGAGSQQDPWPVHSAVLGEPQVVADYDGDGRPEVLITWVDAGEQAKPVSNVRSDLEAQRLVELLSGATGRSIWKHELPALWFQLPEGQPVPPEFRIPVGVNYGYTSSGAGSTITTRRHATRQARRIEQYQQHIYAPTPARLLQVSGGRVIVLTAGRHVQWLEAASGRVLADDVLETWPGRPGTWADADGDGFPDYVFLEQIRTNQVDVSRIMTRLHVWSVHEHRTLWKTNLDARFPWRENWTLPVPNWPVVGDLDGDGVAEVVAPDGSSEPTGEAVLREVPWGGLVVRSGKTGAVLWRRSIVTADQRVQQMALGPDVDADGVRDVMVASVAGVPLKLHVEARSGKTGELLWITPLGVRTETGLADWQVGPLQWWQTGQPDRPRLLVTVHNDSLLPMDAESWVLSAVDGRVIHQRQQAAMVQAIDVDHDGVEDLVTYRARDLAYPEDGGVLDAVRGVPEGHWSQLGGVGEAADDYDGDGVRDFLGMNAAGRIWARSGRTGQSLWDCFTGSIYGYRARGMGQDGPLESGASGREQAMADVDGDGVSDVLFYLNGQLGSPGPLAGAVSGRTGKLLWRTRDLLVRVCEGLWDCRLTDVDQDGRPELVLMVTADLDYPNPRQFYSSDDLQSWLLVVDAHTGRLKWRQPLSPAFGPSAPPLAQRPPSGWNGVPVRRYEETGPLLAVGDLDGDGAPDLLAPAWSQNLSHLVLKAWRGRDGVQLWQHALPVERELSFALTRQHAPRIADLDHDGHAEVILIERDMGAQPSTSYEFVPRVCVLEGASGRVLWRCEAPRRRYEEKPWRDGERTGVSDLALPRLSNGHRAPAILCGGEQPLLFVAESAEHAQVTPLPRPVSSDVLWTVDVDRDGLDELALVHGGAVQLVSPLAPDRPRWTLGGTPSPFARILEVRSFQDSRVPEITAMRRLGDHSVVGIDAASGILRWSCPAPIPREYQGSYATQTACRLDLDGNAASLPFVSYQGRDSVHGRTAHALTESSSRSLSDGARPSSASALRVGRDPRWGRSLPWVAYSSGTWEVPHFLGRAGIYGMVLLILPVVGACWLRRQRANQSVVALVAGLLLGLMTLVSFVPMGSSPPPAVERWKLACFAAPLLALAGAMGWWLWRQCWRRLLVWTLVILAFSGVMGGIQVAHDYVSNPLLVPEYYALDGWPLILEKGFCLASVAWPLMAAYDYWRRRRAHAPHVS